MDKLAVAPATSSLSPKTSIVVVVDLSPEHRVANLGPEATDITQRSTIGQGHLSQAVRR